MDNNTWNGRMLIITVVKHDDDQWSRESPELRKIKYIYIYLIFWDLIYGWLRALFLVFFTSLLFSSSSSFPHFVVVVFFWRDAAQHHREMKVCVQECTQWCRFLDPPPPSFALSLFFDLVFIHFDCCVCVFGKMRGSIQLRQRLMTARLDSGGWRRRPAADAWLGLIAHSLL